MKTRSTGKMTMAEAIAARKAARTPASPTTPPPQTVIDRKNHMARDIARLESCACELRVLSDLVDRLKRPDLDALVRAIEKLEESIKGVRKGMR